MISPGLSATVVHITDEASTAIALGSGDVPVLGTPKVVALAEQAAVAALDGHLDDGVTTVGVTVAVDHIAATAVGGTVHARATVTEVDGRRIHFSIDVTDGATTVARCTHTRVVMDRERFLSDL